MTAEPNPAGRKLKIILDSNALFAPLEFNIDLFEDLRKLLNRNFELVLLSATRLELERIATQGSPTMRKNAALALELAGRCKQLDIGQRTSMSTDDLIVQAAAKYNYPVFTNDRQLRNRLRDINVPVIYVRQKSRLEIDGRL
jgi:rRNA-processing protein FCF1